MESARHRVESALLRVAISGKDGEDLSNEIEIEILRAEAELKACGDAPNEKAIVLPTCNDGIGCLTCWRIYATNMAGVAKSASWCGVHGVSDKLCGECVQERAESLKFGGARMAIVDQLIKDL